MKCKIEFKDGEYGTKAIIKGEWCDLFLKLLLKKEVVELELNDGKGWYGNNIDFVKELTFLKSFTLIDLNIKSIKAVQYLKELRKLKIITYSKDPINFNFFPYLIDCSFEWIRGSESIFEVTGLRNLFISSFKEKSSDNFSKLVHLKELSILNSSIENINGITKLTNLKFLRLGLLRKLNTLQGIKYLNNLEHLEIQKCKRISKICEIFSLINLRCLMLNDIGYIESIKGIEKLKKLECFLFYESTNILDGDITPVLKLKNLRKIVFQNRRHYTHKMDYFQSFNN